MLHSTYPFHFHLVIFARIRAHVRRLPLSASNLWAETCYGPSASGLEWIAVTRDNLTTEMRDNLTTETAILLGMTDFLLSVISFQTYLLCVLLCY